MHAPRLTTAVTASLLTLALVPAGAMAKAGDSDHDGLSNKRERQLHTNAHKADTDGDGLKDGMELKTGNDPRDRDTDNDGVRDGAEHAGMVASFSGGMLTIKLASGKTISGKLDDGARMSCESESEHATENASHHRRNRGASASMAKNGQSGGGSNTADDTSGRNGNDNGAENETENENEVENEHAAENEAGDDKGADCSMADIASGTAVHEAKLIVTSAGITFTKVELVK